jgi:hypothetical protein
MFIIFNSVYMAADFSTAADTTADTDVTDRFEFRYWSKR